MPFAAVMPLTAAIVLMLSGFVTACGGKDDPAPTPTPSAVQAPVAPELPTDERGVIDAFTQALRAKNIRMVRLLTAPELGADLQRKHDNNPELFWKNGQEWIDNIDGGYEIALKQETDKPQWRALLKFVNSKEETVIFTRIQKRLLLTEL